ncbi:MAG TPA: hypothetical protein PL151_21180 [Phycisphaerae bacterium]|nr:hypothetical protein [Phycisphaerae bacterium]HOJ75720.1 hypothetical protein [Phycisphaerae bacterium]HOM53139.1 hypothetical protein [Phycisphaerae bacterium]HPP28015.1 hypothetical protein [Phycisphaerae bacterium]HPU27688.1 hypothetical protein [Phycisphaerae bacterium]
MRRNRVAAFAAVVLGTWCGMTFAGAAEDAAASKKKGDELLAKADFDGALKAYAAAAKADSSNPQYRNEYSMLRQVITLRERLSVEKNPEKWQAGARALRNYYNSHKLYEEALTLDKQLHEKVNSVDSAISLAGSYLALDRAAEAEQVLAAIDPAKLTPEAMIIQAIAQARQSKMDQAKAAAEKIKLPADAGPNLLYNYACLQARIGDKAGAGATLTRCFEQIPPSRLAATKEIARQDPDLAALAGTPELAAALKTESKVKESGCSGGSSCGSCAKKGSCSSASGGSKEGCSSHTEAPAGGADKQ